MQSVSCLYLQCRPQTVTPAALIKLTSATERHPALQAQFPEIVALRAHSHRSGHRAAHLCQVGAAAPGDNLTPSSTLVQHDKLLEHLSDLALPELRRYVQQSTDSISLSFLEWLASREDQLNGDAKLKLAVLAGQLVALREGLDPYNFEEVADELQQHWQATGQPQLPTGNSATYTLAKTSTLELFPSTPASLQQSIVPQRFPGNGPDMQAFSQASIARQYEQVRLFNLDVEQARAKSTIQIIGRKKISAEELTQGTVSSSAQRILKVLLELPSAELRREVLPEAFVSSATERSQVQYETSLESEVVETEQLSTTPLQLLQAVDLELARLSKHNSAEDNKALPGATLAHYKDMSSTLLQLRTDILNIWDPE
ncbi:TPA: hypothetical protein ACH3X1_006170 [Trebouxia sp. C0004]